MWLVNQSLTPPLGVVQQSGGPASKAPAWHAVVLNFYRTNRVAIVATTLFPRQTTRPGFKSLLPVSIAVVFTLKNTGQGVYIELLGEDGVQSLRRYAARDLQQICHGNFANFAHSAALWASPDLLGLPGRGPRYGTPAGIRYATVRLRE